MGREASSCSQVGGWAGRGYAEKSLEENTSNLSNTTLKVKPGSKLNFSPAVNK